MRESKTPRTYIEEHTTNAKAPWWRRHIVFLCIAGIVIVGAAVGGGVGGALVSEKNKSNTGIAQDDRSAAGHVTPQDVFLTILTKMTARISVYHHGQPLRRKPRLPSQLPPQPRQTLTPSPKPPKWDRDLHPRPIHQHPHQPHPLLNKSSTHPNPHSLLLRL